METTEKIVEAYVRYVKRWATIPNVRCGEQKEIDLFAIDPVTNDRFHIETSVSISSGFSKLNDKPFEPDEHKVRIKQASARRKLGYFLEHKFDPPAIHNELAGLGCNPAKVSRIIVTWDASPAAIASAESAGVKVWLLPKMMKEIADQVGERRSYYNDDTLRTLMLFARGLKKEGAVTE